MSELFYLQDARCIVGNSMSWWALGGRGYTCDIRCAQVWTKDELLEENYWEGHGKYLPWPKEKIDQLVQWHIDCQDVQYKSEFPHTLKHWRPELCK